MTELYSWNQMLIFDHTHEMAPFKKYSTMCGIRMYFLKYSTAKKVGVNEAKRALFT